MNPLQLLPLRPILGWRIWRTENRLRAENALWHTHNSACVRCTTAATGTRAQRRAIKGRFCAEGGAMLLRLEAIMDDLKALYAKRKVMQPAANAGQEGS